jgi:hypothetical protein
MIGTLETGNSGIKPVITGHIEPIQEIYMILYCRLGFAKVMQKSVSHYLYNWPRTKTNENEYLGILI